MNWLKLIALILGTTGVIGGAVSLAYPQPVQQFLRNLPRSQNWGRFFLAINLIWGVILIQQTDFRDWNVYKSTAYALSVPIYLFVIYFVNQYLGARWLALFLILLADPVIKVCFLRDEPSSMVITTIAYIWVILGICFFAVPHWFRDWVNFWLRSPSRWSWGCRGKIVIGIALIFLGLFAY